MDATGGQTAAAADESARRRAEALAKIRLAERLTTEQLDLDFDLDLSTLDQAAAAGSQVAIALTTFAATIEATGGTLTATATYPGVEPIDLLHPLPDGSGS